MGLLLLVPLAPLASPAAAQPAGERQARRVSVTVLPPIAQAGRRPAAPPKGKLLVAAVKPPRAGVTLSLTRKTGTGWRAMKNVRTDGRGEALFTVRRSGTYRVGGSGVAAATVKAKVRAPDFRDTFSGRKLDATMWQTEDVDYNPTGLRTCAKPGAAYRVKGGTVQLGIRRDPSQGQPCVYSTPKVPIASSPYLLNTQLVTEDRYEFTHGVAAMRVRFQPARGSHSGFWLQSWRYRQAGQPAQGLEIDVAEYFGHGGNTDSIGAFLHSNTPTGDVVRQGGLFPKARRLLPRGQTWSNSYHVVSVEWTPKKYTFRLDGRVYWQISRWVSQVPQYLVLSNLTSDYELQDLTKASYSRPAAVDWVQVWES